MPEAPLYKSNKMSSLSCYHITDGLLLQEMSCNVFADSLLLGIMSSGQF